MFENEVKDELLIEFISRYPMDTIKILIDIIKCKTSIYHEKIEMPKINDNDINYHKVDYVIVLKYDYVNEFYEKYVKNTDIKWKIHNGLSKLISDSTTVYLEKVDINDKKVLFIHPTSDVVNFKSVDIYAERITDIYNAKIINKKELINMIK